MAADTTEKKPRKNGKRRNFAKDFERLSFYLGTIIRVKDEPGEALTEFRNGELKAYRDIQSYIAPKSAVKP